MLHNNAFVAMYRRQQTFLGMDVKCHIFLPIFNKLLCYRLILIEVLDMKFNRNLSSGNSAGTCGQTDCRADVTMLIGACRDYRNVPTIVKVFVVLI
jgi:hypothetical protein